MKPTLLFATLSMMFASPTVFAKSELDALRAKCQEQERQIQQLELENMKLRSGPTESHSLGGQTELISTSASKPTINSNAGEISKPVIAESNDVYVVKAGDSWDKIGQKVGSSPAALAKANGVKPTALLHPGQKLKVPGTKNAVAEAPPAEKAPATPAVSGKTYKLLEGDTFSSVARKQKISVAALIAANPKLKPTALQAGQIISLGDGPAAAPVAASKAPAPVAKSPAPVAKSSAPVASAPITRTANSITNAPAPAQAAAPNHSTPAPQPAAAQETTSPNPEKKIRPITIEGEMTYGEFAAKHGTNSERLNALNGLDLNNTTILAKGSELYVPAQP